MSDGNSDNSGSKGKPGRPAHKKTPETIAYVSELASNGVPQKMIAAAIGIDKDTLAKHYRSELDVALISKIEITMGALMGRIKEGDVGAMSLFLKTQAGWSEKVQQEISGPDGGSVPVQINFKPVGPDFQSDLLDENENN